MVAQARKSKTQVIARGRELRIDFDRAQERVSALDRATQSDLRGAQPVPSFGLIRIGIDQPLVQLEALVKAIRLQQEQAEVDARIVRVGPRLNGPFERFFGFLQVAE